MKSTTKTKIRRRFLIYVNILESIIRKYSFSHKLSRSESVFIQNKIKKVLAQQQLDNNTKTISLT